MGSYVIMKQHLQTTHSKNDTNSHYYAKRGQFKHCFFSNTKAFESQDPCSTPNTEEEKLHCNFQAVKKAIKE